MTNKMQRKVLLAQFSDGSRGVVRLDLTSKGIPETCLERLGGLQGLVDELFANPHSKAIWGTGNTHSNPPSELEAVWLFLSPETWLYDHCKL